MTMEELTSRVIGLGMAVHRAHGSGFVESVYHRSLEIELAEAGISFESKSPLNVFYKGKPVGNFEADMIIRVGDLTLLLELKAVETILKAHEVQLVNYLAATKIDNGLLLNFGGQSFDFRHKYRLYQQKPKPRSSAQDIRFH